MIAGIVGIGAGIRRPNHGKILHLRFDGESNTFFDLCGKTIQYAGNATQSENKRYYIGKSLQLDGNGDYIYTTDSADFYFSNQPFSFEFVVNRTGSGDASIYRQPNASTFSPIAISIVGNKFATLLSTNGSSWANGSNYLWSSTISTSIPYRLRIVRSGNTFTGYLNGVLDWTYTNAISLYDSSNIVYIGGYPSELYLNASIDEFVIYKGVAITEGESQFTRRK